MLVFVDFKQAFPRLKFDAFDSAENDENGKWFGLDYSISFYFRLHGPFYVIDTVTLQVRIILII